MGSNSEEQGLASTNKNLSKKKQGLVFEPKCGFHIFAWPTRSLGKVWVMCLAGVGLCVLRKKTYIMFLCLTLSKRNVDGSCEMKSSRWTPRALQLKSLVDWSNGWIHLQHAGTAEWRNFWYGPEGTLGMLDGNHCRTDLNFGKSGWTMLNKRPHSRWRFTVALHTCNYMYIYIYIYT